MLSPYERCCVVFFLLAGTCLAPRAHAQDGRDRPTSSSGGGIDLSDLKSAPPEQAGAGGDIFADPMPSVIGGKVSPEAVAAYERGKSLASDGNMADAVGQFHQAAQIDANFPQAHFALGEALESIGQHRLAAKSFSKAIAASPRAAALGEIYFARGKAYLDAGELTKSLGDFDQAVQTSPANPDYLYHQGRALLRIGARDYRDNLTTAGETIQRAIDALDRAIERRPGYAEAFADRAAARADMGQIDDAIADAKAAADLRPDDAQYLYQLGLLYLRRAAATDAGDSELAAQRRDDLSTAIANLTSALQWDDLAEDSFDANDARLMRAVARIELASLEPAADRASAYQASLADCDQVLAEDRNSPLAHFHRGVALRLAGRLRDAIDAWTACLRLAPENTEARIRRGIAWYYLDEFDLAASDFRSVGVVAGDPRPDFWLGVIHARRGDHFQAIRSYTAALAQSRSYRLAYANRSLAYMHLGAWQRAIDDLNQLIQLNPHDAAAYYRRGLAQQQLGRTAEARRSWQKAMQYDPSHPQASELLSRGGG